MTASPITPNNNRQQPSVGRRVALGAVWVVAMRWTVRLIGMGSTIVLARILVPEDFGLVAIATSFVALLDAFSDLGTRTAMIRRDELDQRFMDTVFTVQCLRGLSVGIAVFALGYVLPLVIDDPRLRDVAWCLSLQPVIFGLLNPALTKFERQMDFRRELAIQVSAKLAATSTTIICAVIFRSHWAMIAGILVDTSLRVMLSYTLAPFRPHVSLALWRELFRFSGWLSGSYFIEALIKGTDEILISAMLNVRTAGIYNVGKQLANMPLGEILPPINRALFPGLLRFKDDKDKLRENSLHAFTVFNIFSIPVATGFFLIAEDFVRVLYGEKWLDAVVIIQAISICVGMETLGGSISTSVAMTLSRTRLLFWRSAARALLRIPVFILGLWMFGLNGALVGYVVGSLIYLIFNIHIMRSLLEIQLAPIFRAIWPATLASLAMAAAVVGISDALQSWQESILATMVAMTIKIISGAAAYFFTQWALWKVFGGPELAGILLTAFRRR